MYVIDLTSGKDTQQKNPSFLFNTYQSTKSTPMERRGSVDSLMRRHHKSQSRIHAKRLKQSAKEMQELTEYPRINELSRQLSQNSMLKTATNFRKKLIKERTLFKVNLSKLRTSTPRETPKLMSTHLSPNNKESYSREYYESLTFIDTSPSNADHVKYSQLETSIENRTMEWLKHKNQKIEKKRKEKKVIEESLSSNSLWQKKSTKKVKKTISCRALARKLSPTYPVLGYSDGFNWRKFISRAKPMIKYSNVKK